MSNREHIVACLRKMYSCNEARTWVAGQPDDVRLSDLWMRCPYQDWMEWFVDALYLNGQSVNAELRDVLWRALAARGTDDVRRRVGWTGWHAILTAWRARFGEVGT